jgi:transmembrane protein 132
LSTNQFYLFQVYARFLAKDHDSGRVSYFVSRRTWLKVTELVLTLMRVSDPRIASLRGKVLQGRSTGRTEVQVLSPITGKQNDSITKAL